MQGYLKTRTTLAGVVWLLDLRHPPSTDDLAMQELLGDSGRPVLAVFTKADKLGRAARVTRARELADSLGLDEDQTQVVSSVEGSGIADLGDSILAAVSGEEGG